MIVPILIYSLLGAGGGWFFVNPKVQAKYLVCKAHIHCPKGKK